MGLSNKQFYVTTWVGFGFGIFSLILTILTLVIIYIMAFSTSQSRRESAKRHSHSLVKINTVFQTVLAYLKLSNLRLSGYLFLIVSMELFQILYDLEYILGISRSYSGCITQQYFRYLGGLSVTLWTNIISFIIYYVVTYIQSVVMLSISITFSALSSTFAYRIYLEILSFTSSLQPFVLSS